MKNQVRLKTEAKPFRIAHIAISFDNKKKQQQNCEKFSGS